MTILPQPQVSIPLRGGVIEILPPEALSGREFQKLNRCTLFFVQKSTSISNKQETLSLEIHTKQAIDACQLNYTVFKVQQRCVDEVKSATLMSKLSL